MDMGIKPQCDTFVVPQQVTPFWRSLARTVELLGVTAKDFVYVSEENYEDRLLGTDYKRTCVLLDLSYDVYQSIYFWLWQKTRLNSEKLGIHSGTPLIVFSHKHDWLEGALGAVFRERGAHHKCLSKPLVLPDLLSAFVEVASINPSDLRSTIKYCPESLKETLQDDHHLGGDLAERAFDLDRCELEEFVAKRELELLNLRELAVAEDKCYALEEGIARLRRRLMKPSL